MAPPISRRAVLAGITGGLAALAGCGAVLGRELGPPPANVHCPTYERSGDGSPSVYCYRDLPADDWAMVLEPSRESGELPEASFTFTLRNETRRTFTFGPSAWQLHKQYDGAWYHLAPYEIPLPALGLQPRDEYSWSVRVDNTDHPPPVEWPVGDETLTFAGLGAGTYAFGIDGSFGEERARVAFSGTFRLEGAPLEVTPTERVGTVTRRGRTVYVDTEGTAEDARLGIVTTRIGDASDATVRALPEEIIRHPPIRNSLAFVDDDVNRIVHRTGAPARTFVERLTGPGQSGYWTVEFACGDGAFRMERGTIDPAAFGS